jgi:hypothetical protein
MRLAFAALAALALAGCQSLRPKAERAPAPPPAQVIAANPILIAPDPPPPPAAPTSCVPKTVGAPPRYPDTDAALKEAAGAADRYQLLAAGRLMRQKRLEELERAIAGCR